VAAGGPSLELPNGRGVQRALAYLACSYFFNSFINAETRVLHFISVRTGINQCPLTFTIRRAGGSARRLGRLSRLLDSIHLSCTISLVRQDDRQRLRPAAMPDADQATASTNSSSTLFMRNDPASVTALVAREGRDRWRTTSWLSKRYWPRRNEKS